MKRAKPGRKCQECDCPMLPDGKVKRENEYDHARGCPEAYPNIKKACFLVALDNDGINRHRTETQWSHDYSRWIERKLARDRWPPQILAEADLWLGTLSDDDLDTFCCGGDDERERVSALKAAPPFCNELLDTYFGEVC